MSDMAAGHIPVPDAVAWPNLDSDDRLRDNDGDSALGSTMMASDWAFISSIIWPYRQENGRRYHAYNDGNYILPNDELEHDRSTCSITSSC